MSNRPLTSVNSNVTLITPEIAKSWLALNKHNRPLNATTVKTYAGAMRRGEWVLNGEPIIFSTEGRLLSGQHRLHACIASGASFHSLVVRGIKPTAFSTMDQTRRRTAADVLAIQGVHNYVAAATAARAILIITLSAAESWNITNTLIDECVKQHPALQHWTASYTPRKKLFPASFLGVVTLMDELHGRDTTQQFFDQCVEGVGLEKYSPALTLRERFIGRARGVQFSPAMAIAFFIKAANAHLQQRSLKVLRMSEGEARPRLLGMHADE